MVGAMIAQRSRPDCRVWRDQFHLVPHSKRVLTSTHIGGLNVQTSLASLFPSLKITSLVMTSLPYLSFDSPTTLVDLIAPPTNSSACRTFRSRPDQICWAEMVGETEGGFMGEVNAMKAVGRDMVDARWD